MIRLITGVTRLNGRVFTPNDGAFEADRKTEEYLVNRGVAEYVGGKAEKPVPAPAPVIPDEDPTEDSPTLDVEKPKTSRKRR